MSANGVPCSWDGSGDVEAFGVGNIGGASIATDEWALLVGAALLRFLGDPFFVGEVGSALIDSSGSNSSEGSTLSPVRVFRVRAAVRWVGGTSVVLRLV